MIFWYNSSVVYVIGFVDGYVLKPVIVIVVDWAVVSFSFKVRREVDVSNERTVPYDVQIELLSSVRSSGK